MPLVPLPCSAICAPEPREVAEKKNLAHKTVQVDAFVVAGTIGGGVCGKIKRAALGGRAVALKAISKEIAKREAVQREVFLQAKCHDHDSVLTCFDLMESKNKYFVAMELGQCDLFDLVLDLGAVLEEDDVKRMAFQLLSGVAHMHAKGVCHRDIKPENIVVLPNDQIALTDFGYAMEWSEGDEMQSSTAGTIRCLPPEMFIKDEQKGTRQYNPQLADAWGVGVVLFFVLSSRFPFDRPTAVDTASAIVSGQFTNALPKDTPEAARDLVMKLLAADPKQRLSAKSALRHPFVRGLAPNHST